MSDWDNVADDYPAFGPITNPELIDKMLVDLAHPAWERHDPMPGWLTGLRPHQVEAIQLIAQKFQETDHVILDAPVGSGKTVIADLSRRLLGTNASYICTTKTLQDQFARDFPEARILKGRANYPTKFAEFPEVTAADCTAGPSSPMCFYCDHVDDCHYQIAKRQALAATTAVLNTSYWLTESNGPGRFGHKDPRGLTIIDECDTFEDALMSFVEVEVSPTWRRKLGIGLPKVKTQSAKSNDWIEWSEEALSAATAYWASLPPASGDIQLMRHRRSTKNLVDRLRMLVQMLPEGAWIYDGYDRNPPTAVFKPVMVDKVAEQAAWRHGNKFLLMSGSVVSAREMADSLGIPHWRAVNVAVDWDPGRRPIYVAPVANVVWRNKDEAYPAVARAVREIIDHHPGERVLVHAVNYQLTKAIHQVAQGNGRPVFTYTNAAERERALALYMDTPGSVIVAPSLDRGVDFIDDLARVQVICKVPFPSLGDKQVRTRANMGSRGKTWFKVCTVRSIIQMVGRGMRHEDDWCVTYVLDEQMDTNIMQNSKSLVPKWVRASMIREQRPWLRAAERVIEDPGETA